LRGLPCVGLGIGIEDAHSPKEHIAVAQMEKGVQFIEALLTEAREAACHPDPVRIEGSDIAPAVVALMRELIADVRLHGYLSQGFQYRLLITIAMSPFIYLVWTGRVRKLLIALHAIACAGVVVTFTWGSSVLYTILQLLYSAPGLWLLTRPATAAFCHPDKEPLCDLRDHVDRPRALKTAAVLTCAIVCVMIACGYLRTGLADPVEDDGRVVSLCPAKGWTRLPRDEDCLLSFSQVCKDGGVVKVTTASADVAPRSDSIYTIHLRSLGRAAGASVDALARTLPEDFQKRHRGFVPVRKVTVTYGGQRWLECFGTFTDDPVHRGLFVFLTVCQGFCFEIAVAGERYNLEMDQDLLRSVVGTFRLVDLPEKLLSRTTGRAAPRPALAPPPVPRR